MKDHQIQVSQCGTTVWVHALDGSTVGRFSKTYGMDVHTTTSEQLKGSQQCLHCTHIKPDIKDWYKFCELMEMHYLISVPRDAISFKESTS